MFGLRQRRIEGEEARKGLDGAMPTHSSKYALTWKWSLPPDQADRVRQKGIAQVCFTTYGPDVELFDTVPNAGIQFPAGGGFKGMGREVWVELPAPSTVEAKALDLAEATMRSWHTWLLVERPLIQISYMATAWILSDGERLGFCGSAQGDITVTPGALDKFPAQAFSFDVPDYLAAMASQRAEFERGRLSAQSVGYFFLTAMEDVGRRARPNIRRKRDAAAVWFNIDCELLSRLGELTTARGSWFTARKATADNVPLTDAEKAWLRQTIHFLVLQAAAAVKANGPPPAQLTLTPGGIPTLDLTAQRAGKSDDFDCGKSSAHSHARWPTSPDR